MADPQAPGWPPVAPDPSPPAPGIVQPQFASGSTTSPDPSTVFPDFTPVFPPPVLGSSDFAADPAVPPATGNFGIEQPQFATGDASTPVSLWPEFTTTFPEPPVTVQTTPPPPNMITTTPPIEIDGWGPGAGPQAPPPPVWTTPPLETDESELDYMERCIPLVMQQGADEGTAEEACQAAYEEAIGGNGARSLHNGNSAVPERRTGSVLQSADADSVHKPKSKKGRSRKRMSPRSTPRHHDKT